MSTNRKHMTESDVIGIRKRALEFPESFGKTIYDFDDLFLLSGVHSPVAGLNALDNLDRLLERDDQREKDGFPRKIIINHALKPGRNNKDNIIIIPTTEEDKFYHGIPMPKTEYGGTGEEGEGDVISEKDIEGEHGEGEAEGAGEGGSGDHEIEKRAYELGKTLTEEFKLPNIRDREKKSQNYRVEYDLCDRNRGTGQILNKMATLFRIVKTNISLGRLSPDNINPKELLVSPNDKIFNILSEQRIYESKAMVFFVRDYSGSMSGAPAEVVTRMHLLIYCWLLYQYEGQVSSRFILHDTKAKEVSNFSTYYSSRTGGGTNIHPAYKLVREIIEGENLANDYNIYLFHGTDGDDWDTEGHEALEEIQKLLEFCNRIGITIAENSYNDGKTIVEKYFKKSGLLDNVELIKLDSFTARDAPEERIIKSIKTLLS